MMQLCCAKRHEDMDVAKVLSHMCMSLDGFIAQPDDNPAELFEWYWGGEVVLPSAQETMSAEPSSGARTY
jgi:hypothetical protein